MKNHIKRTEEVKKSFIKSKLSNYNSIEYISVEIFKDLRIIDNHTVQGIIKFKIKESKYIAEKLIYGDFMNYIEWECLMYKVNIKWLKENYKF